jgi:hypothetical protein
MESYNCTVMTWLSLNFASAFRLMAGMRKPSPQMQVDLAYAGLQAAINDAFQTSSSTRGSFRWNVAGSRLSPC